MILQLPAAVILQKKKKKKRKEKERKKEKKTKKKRFSRLKKILNGSQLAKVKKYIPYMSLP